MVRLAAWALCLLGCLCAIVHADEPDARFMKWWHNYKRTFITSTGRVQRPNDNSDTVSEGQAYAMLLAVLADDRNTFDKLFDWTDHNLSRRNRPDGDHLLAWHWQGGKVADAMPAADADCDFAWALLIAGRVWGEDSYLIYGHEVMTDILDLEVVAGVGDRLLLLPGLWGRLEDGSIIQNPSYYSPAAFRMFHELTGDERWRKLIETSYWIWERSSQSLGNLQGVGLQPDWFMVTPDARLVPAPGRSTDYGWESVRMPLRIGLDMLLAEEARSRPLLTKIIARCSASGTRPSAVLQYTGEPAVSYDSLAALAMNRFARELLEPGSESARSTFHSAVRSMHTQKDYYGQSLSGFTLALEARRFSRLRRAAKPIRK